MKRLERGWRLVQRQLRRGWIPMLVAIVLSPVMQFQPLAGCCLLALAAGVYYAWRCGYRVWVVKTKEIEREADTTEE